ncbi:MAG: DUF2341 domain-containing protein [Bacteroidota bacterium]|nr:DUF2341 domain-containing protein [Bacteroidota bacterium]
MLPSFLTAQAPVNYAYTRAIVITNPNAAAISNLQMEFDLSTDMLVATGKMQADGDDISFMDTCEELFYWVEDSSFNTTRTTFWVKIPSAPPGTHTIYMYYGDPSATPNPHRNGDSTFVFFDDFNTGVSPNSAKWTLVSNNGNDVHTQTAAGHYLPTANLSNLSIGLAHGMVAGNYEIGSKLRITNIGPFMDFDAEIGWFQFTVMNVNRVATWVNDDELPSDYTGANGVGNVYTVSTQAIYGRWSYPRIRTIGNQVTTRRFSYSPSYFNELGPAATFVPATIANLYIGSSAYQGQEGKFDFIFVRNAVAIEPSLILQGELPNPWIGFTNFQATSNGPICPGDTLQLNATPLAGATYSWNGPSGFSSTQNSESVLNASSGMYAVVANLGGACVEDSVTVQTFTSPSFVQDTFFCGTHTLTIGASPLPGSTYQWTSSPPGFTSTFADPVITASVTTTYFLVQTASGGCTFYDTVTIVINPQPVAAFNVISIDGQPEITLADQSQNADNYYWSFGDGNTSAGIPSGYTYASDGSYTIQLITVNDFGCSDTAWQAVEVVTASTLYVPNAFTPNGHGNNELFFISSYNLSSMEVMIFDRWGQLITEWKTIDGYWDGKLKGRNCPVDVYVYVVHAIGNDGKKYHLYGHVSLIR